MSYISNELLNRYAYAALAMSSLYAVSKLKPHYPLITAENEGAGGIERTRINQMFELIEDEITLYHFYNSNNPLHEEMNKLIAESTKNGVKKACAQICSIDIFELAEKDKDLLFLATGKTREEIMRANKPIFVLKTHWAFKTVDSKIVCDEEALRKYINAQVKTKHIKTLNQFADKLKENKKLNDCLVVYYLPVKPEQNAKKAISDFEDRNLIALNLLRGETDNILVITDPKLAETCRLEPKKFYSYFKPSYLNGFENLVDKDLNVEYLQAFEGLCRDEFTPNNEYLQSEEFMNAIHENENQFTEKLVNEHFDQAFNRTTNIQFLMNPNFKSRYLSNNAELPQCFIYVPDEYMKKYIFEIKQAIADYQDTFEFVYTNDHEEASRYLFLDEYPDVMPFFVIVDKSKKIPVRPIDAEPIKNFSDVIKDANEVPPETDFYYCKYKTPIFLTGMVKEIQSFLDKFLEGNLDPYYQTEKMVQKTNVREICGDNFAREVIKNPDVKYCIIEVFKHDCPSCMFNGKWFNAFSRKLQKHGVADKLPLFRLAIDNKIPYLGSFAYSPIYFFLKKEGENVTEVAIIGKTSLSNLIDNPVKYKEFISCIKKYTGLDEELKNIDMVPKRQVRYHFTLKDLDPDFDIDMDIAEEAAEQAELQKKEKEEAEAKLKEQTEGKQTSA